MKFLFPHMARYEPFFQVDHMALPSVTLLWCHVASSNLAMCHPSPHALKNVKSRPPRNPTKLDVVTKFRETISTEKSVSYPRSRKIPDFYRNYDFTLFEKIGILSGLTQKNTKNVLSKTLFCYLNLVFFIFFRRIKKNLKPNMLSLFFCSPYFLKTYIVLKNNKKNRP